MDLDKRVVSDAEDHLVAVGLILARWPGLHRKRGHGRGINARRNESLAGNHADGLTLSLLEAAVFAS